jgi:hypothetical protein
MPISPPRSIARLPHPARPPSDHWTRKTSQKAQSSQVEYTRKYVPHVLGIGYVRGSRMPIRVDGYQRVDQLVFLILACPTYDLYGMGPDCDHAIWKISRLVWTCLISWYPRVSWPIRAIDDEKWMEGDEGSRQSCSAWQIEWEPVVNDYAHMGRDLPSTHKTRVKESCSGCARQGVGAFRTAARFLHCWPAGWYSSSFVRMLMVDSVPSTWLEGRELTSAVLERFLTGKALGQLPLIGKAPCSRDISPRCGRTEWFRPTTAWIRG